MEVREKYLKTSWYEDFECPGGDCGLTCCGGWRIGLTDDEVQRYLEDSSDFRETLMSAIDIEEKAMKCVDGKCVLLNEDGFCKLILANGPSALSRTCTIFPRGEKKYCDIVEKFVEICCPRVAKMLLDNKELDFLVEDSNRIVSFSENDATIYDLLNSIRIKLMELVKVCPNSYTYGKLFIMLHIIEDIKSVSTDGTYNIDALKFVADKYFNEDLLLGIFNKCNALSNNYGAKAYKTWSLLHIMYKANLMQAIAKKLEGRLPGYKEMTVRWMNNVSVIESDFEKIIPYLRLNYGHVAEKFLEYSIFINFIEMDCKDIGYGIYKRIIESTLVLIGLMIDYIDKKEITVDRYAYILACVDRVMAHSENIQSVIDECVNEVGTDNAAGFLLLFVA